MDARVEMDGVFVRTAALPPAVCGACTLLVPADQLPKSVACRIESSAGTLEAEYAERDLKEGRFSALFRWKGSRLVLSPTWERWE